jgi:endonuclease III
MSMSIHEQKVYDALKKAGVTEDTKAKKVDDIAKMVAPMGKGQVSSAIASLTSKGYLAVGGASRANAYYVKK